MCSVVDARLQGALCALYGRALRDRPELAGKVVLEIDIDAAGRTTACRVKSTLPATTAHHHHQANRLFPGGQIARPR
jgi:hypothetical protein